MAWYVGTSVERAEDPALLRGELAFSADLSIPEAIAAGRGMTEAIFVRSPFAHARILSVDIEEARHAAGVVAVLTADDHDVRPYGSVFPEFFDARYAMPILAEGTVRFVGEPVVVVVAETRAQALDAAELVVIDWEPLDAVIDVHDSLNGPTHLFTDDHRARTRTTGAGGETTNVVHELQVEHDRAAFETDVVVDHTFWNPRQLPTPMETHVQVTAWDAKNHVHIWASIQRPHGFRDQIADVFELDPSTIHVHAPGVGGAFGGKVGRTQEEHALVMIAREVGRPVRWVQTRGEYFTGATQGRGEHMTFRLAGTKDGRVTALSCHMLKDSGAYPGVGATLPARFNSFDVSGPYDIAHCEFSSTAVVTNAPQVSAYRGAGRAAYIAALERMMDIYAAEIGVDPVDVRRKNLVRKDQMPFTAVTGVVYDEADYEGDLDRALAAADYDSLRAEQGERRASGANRQLGIGIATYHLQTVGAGGSEEVRVEIEADGRAVVYTGTTDQGHGHTATWAQIAADTLGMAIEHIVVSEGSTDHTATGVGAVGSRSLQTAGVAIQTASSTLLARAHGVAADLLEASVADISCEVVDVSGAPEARFHVAGVPSVYVGWPEVAEVVHDADSPGDPDELVCGETHNLGENTAFPSGTHIAVVEVDTDTGKVDLIRFIGVDDCGVRVNPMIVEGQLHGGMASGISQVLGEEMRYDDDGNPLTTNFGDYALATADVVPSFELIASETPTSFNTLRAKGVGEAGGVGSVGALHNAVVDAVRHLGVAHIELPCTPQRVWQAIQDVRATS
ncbi:MAG: carbon-monoxide dehydrogenase large subunit [Verrucomicrobiales bacterium]|jgi:carbon-monoxide dehydrogenase large subunit